MSPSAIFALGGECCGRRDAFGYAVQPRCMGAGDHDQDCGSSSARGRQRGGVSRREVGPVSPPRAHRGGASVSYDVIPWNFYTNANPVQLQVVLTPTSACLGTFGAPPAWCSTPNGSGFLADGGMQNVAFAPPSTTAAARAQTANLMADAAAPKVFTWSLSVQHEIFKNTSLEIRYLGTRALELPVQLQLNSISPFELGAQPLPTFFSAADIPATVSLTAPTLAKFQALQTRRFASDGFTGGALTIESPVGDSTYHGAAIEWLAG